MIAIDPLGLTVKPATNRVDILGFDRPGESSPQRIVTIDDGTGAILANVPILMWPDSAIVVDPGINRLYGSGLALTEPGSAWVATTVAVAHQ